MSTSIEWTHMPGFDGDVWNPTTGCTRVSAGCDNCYAFALHDKRYAANRRAASPVAVRDYRESGGGKALPWPKQYDLPFSHVQLLEERVDAPWRKRKPTCYFVDSMADLFHEDVPDLFIARVLNVMGMVAQHRFLILTKRPDRMYAVARAYYETTSQQPFANVWLGTSVEDQRSADERIPHLLATPAAVRFLSCEPLLGPIDIAKWSWGNRCPDRQCGDSTWDHDCELGEQRLHWVIAGGESGPRARPMDLAWARSLRDQCAAAGVSFFMKQIGARVVDDSVHANGAWWRHRESHGRDPEEWPDDLRIRTWPS